MELDIRLLVGVGAAVAGLALGFFGGWFARGRRDGSIQASLVVLQGAFHDRFGELAETVAELRCALLVGTRARTSSDTAKTTVYPPQRPLPPVYASRDVPAPPRAKAEVKTAVVSFNPFDGEDEHAHG